MRQDRGDDARSLAVVPIAVRSAVRGVRSIIALAKASHPGPVVAVTAAATGYAVAIGAGWRQAWRAGGAVLAGQLAVGWHNDWHDAELDRRARRVEKPIAHGEIEQRTVGVFAALAALAAVPASLGNGRRAGAVHLAAVASAFTYNAGVKASPASFVPYGVAFSLLPTFVHLATRDELPPYWAPAAAGTLGVAAHFINVLPDRESDRESGVLGLPQRISRQSSIRAAAVLLAASSACTTFGPHGRSLRALVSFLPSLALGALVVRSATSTDDDLPFRLVLTLAVVNVAQLVASRRVLQGVLRAHP